MIHSFLFKLRFTRLMAAPQHSLSELASAFGLHINSDLSVYASIFLITLAGTPPTIVFDSTSLVTTAPAATTAPSLIVTPANTVALAPIQTF